VPGRSRHRRRAATRSESDCRSRGAAWLRNRPRAYIRNSVRNYAAAARAQAHSTARPGPGGWAGRRKLARRTAARCGGGRRGSRLARLTRSRSLTEGSDGGPSASLSVTPGRACQRGSGRPQRNGRRPGGRNSAPGPAGGLAGRGRRDLKLGLEFKLAGGYQAGPDRRPAPPPARCHWHWQAAVRRQFKACSSLSHGMLGPGCHASPAEPGCINLKPNIGITRTNSSMLSRSLDFRWPVLLARAAGSRTMPCHCQIRVGGRGSAEAALRVRRNLTEKKRADCLATSRGQMRRYAAHVPFPIRKESFSVCCLVCPAV
jgi:hypothetical protein